MGAHETTWEPMRPHGSPWMPVGGKARGKAPIGCHGNPCPDMGSYGLPTNGHFFEYVRVSIEQTQC